MDETKRNDITLELLGHADWLRSLALSLVRDEHEADELVQRTWLAAARRPPGELSSPRGWLVRVMNRLRSRDRRDRARERRHLEDYGRQHPSATDDDGLTRLQRHRDLIDRLMRLRDPYRETLVLRYFDGLSRREIARRLDVPEETVKTRLRRGLDLLREELRGRHGDDEWRAVVLAAAGFDPARFAGDWASTAAGILGGGILVSTSTKIGTAAVIAAIVVSTWFGFTNMSGELEDLDTSVEESVDEIGSARPARHARVPATSKPVPAEARASVVDGRKSAAVARESPRYSIKGVVVDDSNRPVAGADVYWYVKGKGFPLRALTDFSWQIGEILRSEADADSSFMVTSRQESCVKTGEDGGFSIPLDVDGDFEIGAFHASCGPGVVLGLTVEEAAREERLVIELRRGFVFQGTVRDGRGRPVEGACIRLGGGTERMIAAVGTVYSDAEGRYETWPLPFERFLHHCSKPGYFRRDADLTPSSDRRVVELDFELEDSPWLEGNLVDGSGEPIDLDAELEARLGGTDRKSYLSEHPLVLWGGWEPSNDSPSRSADATRFELHLAEARYRVRYDSRYARWIGLNMGPKTIGRGRVVSFDAAPDLVIEAAEIPVPTPRFDVKLRVLDRSGHPVADYTVEWGAYRSSELKNLRRSRRHTVAAADGRFSLARQPGRLHRLSVDAEGFAEVVLDVLPGAGEPEIVVRLDPVVGSIAGTVHRADGTPFPGVFVYALPANGEGWGEPGGSKFLKTDQKGRFEIKGLAAGSYLVVTDANELVIPPARVIVEKGRSACELRAVPTVEIELVPIDVVGSMQFALTDRAGRVFKDDALRGRTSRGGAPVHDVPPGRYTLIVRSPGHHDVRQDFVASPGARVEFRMTPRD